MISKITELYVLRGDIQIPTENTVHYWNDYKDDRTLHSLFGHSNSNWQNLTSFVGTFKLQLEKTVQYPNDFKMTEPYIFCFDIQIPTEKGSLVSKWFQR